MRKLVWTLTAAMALPYPALAQQGPTRSVDEYVCTFSDEGCEQAAEAADPTQETTTEKGRARVSSTRGFSLARPKVATTPTATAPTSAAPAGTARTATAPATSRPATPAGSRRTQTATAASRPRGRAAAASAPRAERRRADLRLSFDLGSATLTQQARDEAKVFAAALNTPQLSGKRFVIEGHTDSIGGRAYNIDLSRRRAEAVADYLGSLGVDRSRLDIRGYGFDRPLDGRSASAVENRRVEAVLASG